MTLAQVVYNFSNDENFADKWSTDPEGALEEKGLELSKEEQAFLFTVLNRYDMTNAQNVKLADLSFGSPWIHG